MSTETSLNCRRSRSTSISSSPLPRSKHDGTWQLSTKRACPSSPGCVSYPPKWKDVDMWRRGKRSRRGTSPTIDNFDSQRFSPSKHSFLQEDSSSSASTSSAPPTPHFATTSAEFNLYRKRHGTQSNPRSPHPQSDPIVLSTDTIDNNIDLIRLRSDAFWELRRSVAESGEGLVRRMRDYESFRSRAGVYSKAKDSLKRGRKRHSISTRPRRPIGVGYGSDAEDEIQIFAGAGSPQVDIGTTRKKRAFSVGMADAHISSSPFMDLPGGGRCFSPTTTFSSGPSSGPSAYPSDDEESMDLVNDSPFDVIGSSSSSSVAPTLPRSFTTSTNSSFTSLSSHCYGIPPPQHHHHPIIFTSPSSSRSEKAIAALSLAMANGAGGINDYEALRAVETAPILEDTHVGELWH